MKSVNDIRAGFLDFFRRNGHEVRPSGSLVPHNDPTLMFTNAGMNQFKNVFTGAEKLPFSRAATSQKCVRAGGKHNDLDNVGYTARHHTFFEMLGNFSFGDYFKETAIELAWDLLTKDCGLSPEKLTVTIYHDDDVAWKLWKSIAGLPDHKIIRIATNDNFWSMGDTGPCGPCSEIFYDHGDKIPGGPPGSPDADGDRFVEIWNLVFMQYEQLADGKRINLPKPSIDTGMGLERLAAVMQGVHDNYDIDLFKHLIAAIRQIGGTAGEPAAYKVIADHLRSSCFLIADGVMPSNEGRGYVLRRIMRRAMRYAHQMGCKEPLMYKLVPSLITEMGEAYPELKRAQATITDNLREEEERFKQTLDRGLKLLEDESATIKKGGTLSGEAAFKLYDTFGFPLDLTQDILRARGIGVDTDSFEKAMEGQRDMARASHKGSGDTATGRIWFELKEKLGATEFLGYDADEADGKILAIVKDGQEVQSANRGDEVSIILDKTPFYGESGGQVGDSGNFLLGTKIIAEVSDTQKPLEDFIFHETKLLGQLKKGDTIHAAINKDARNATRANHSATHLLHKALRELLGDHVTQKGSLVESTRLRFDFSHPKPMNKDEIKAIEQRINAVISHGGLVETKEMTPDDAIAAGAMALFGEKYGDKVRVLSMGFPITLQSRPLVEGKIKLGEMKTIPYSIELCGGTHVHDVSNIGLFKVTSEGSVASGIRRIEAVTGEGVREYFEKELHKLSEQLQKARDDNAKLLSELQKKPAVANFKLSPDALKNVVLKDVPGIYEKQYTGAQEAIRTLQDDNKKLAKELAEVKKQQALGNSEVKVEKIGSVNFIGKIFDGLDPKELRPIAEEYRKQADVVALGTAVEGRASMLVASGGGNSVALVQAAVAELGGKGGGGRPEMAQGGGPDADKLPAALDKIKSLIASS